MMNRDELQKRMMERLFGEISPDNDEALENHLRDNPDDAAEWDGLQSTHLFYQDSIENDLPTELDEVMLAAIRDELPLESEKPKRALWYFPAAASLLLLFGAGYLDWVVRQPGSEIATAERLQLAQQAPQVSLELAGKSAEDRITTGYSVVPVPQNKVLGQEEIQPTQPLNTRANPTDAKADETETIFRQGLQQYNQAFARTGAERKTGLTQAVYVLEKVEPDRTQDPRWTAMAKILIADSRHQNDDDNGAVSQYSEVIAEYPNLEPYNRIARASMIKTLLESDGKTGETATALNEFEDRYADDALFPKMAMELAEQLKENQPEDALIWYAKVRGHTNTYHPLHERAAAEARGVEKTIASKYDIKDWWFTQPLSIDAVRGDVPNIFHVSEDRQSIQPFNPLYTGEWQRHAIGEQGEADVQQILNSLDHRSVYAATFVYSPVERHVIFSLKASNGLRVWINGESVWGAANGMNYNDGGQNVKWYLKEGWNVIMLKSYHHSGDDWKFAFRILDHEGHILPDLKFAPDDL